MKHGETQKLNDADFRTVTGFKRETFKEMIAILQQAETKKRQRGGPKPDFCVEDKLLIACQYWREYRTYLHIGATFGTTKGNVCKTIKWVENVLIKSGKFNLPGKKKLTQSDVQYEIVLMDATESPIYRPKKSKSDTIQVKRSDTPLNRK